MAWATRAHACLPLYAPGVQAGTHPPQAWRGPMVCTLVHTVRGRAYPRTHLAPGPAAGAPSLGVGHTRNNGPWSGTTCAAARPTAARRADSSSGAPERPSSDEPRTAPSLECEDGRVSIARDSRTPSIPWDDPGLWSPLTDAAIELAAATFRRHLATGPSEPSPRRQSRTDRASRQAEPSPAPPPR